MEFGLFNVLHSGGKGIYQQSIDEGLLGSFLAEAPSFAMEESIGRFYENIIGPQPRVCQQVQERTRRFSAGRLKADSGADIQGHKSGKTFSDPNRS